MGHKYTQHDGYDKYKVTDGEKTTHNGRADYNDDGTLKRLSDIAPASSDPESHYHTWMNRQPDGSYDFGCEMHKNH